MSDFHLVRQHRYDKTYWLVRRNVWDPDAKASQSVHLGSLGPEPIPRSRIDEFAERREINARDLIRALQSRGVKVEGTSAHPPPVVLTCSVERRVYDALVERAERRGVDVARHAADILTGVALNRDLA